MAHIYKRKKRRTPHGPQKPATRPAILLPFLSKSYPQCAIRYDQRTAGGDVWLSLYRAVALTYCHAILILSLLEDAASRPQPPSI